MNKDSPESIIIWHKMERSGFLPASSICVKNACWGISRLELEHQCHGQAPAASHRTILEGKSPKAETSLALVTTLSTQPRHHCHGLTFSGHKHTPLNPSEHLCTSIPPHEWRDSVPTALGKKEFSSAPACNRDRRSEMALAKKSTRQGFKPDLQNSLPNTGKPFRTQWQLWDSDWLGKLEQSLWKSI